MKPRNSSRMMLARCKRAEFTYLQSAKAKDVTDRRASICPSVPLPFMQQILSPRPSLQQVWQRVRLIFPFSSTPLRFWRLW